MDISLIYPTPPLKSVTVFLNFVVDKKLLLLKLDSWVGSIFVCESCKEIVEKDTEVITESVKSGLWNFDLLGFLDIGCW